MLKIHNLHAKIDNKEVLRGINLEIKPGEVHVIMGPNGSGKSTLSNILAGRPDFNITAGNIEYFGEDLLKLLPEERAHRGLFLSFQYPAEIAGINNMYFLKTALNNLRKYNQEPEIDAFDFLTLVKSKCKIVSMDESFLQRSVNAGFSGGEKKRNEILQMLVLEPKLTILDEPDSGLDIDALQLVAKGINAIKDPNKSIILVTHYQRLLDFVTPEYIHILYNGKIVKSGTKELALELEQKGYSWLED